MGTSAAAIAWDVHSVHVEPHVGALRDQTKKVYAENLAEHVDPMLKGVSQQYKALKVDEMVNQVGSASFSVVSDLYTLGSDQVLPAMSGVMKGEQAQFVTGAIGDVLSQLGGQMFEPVTFGIYGEDFYFENGLWDILCIGFFISLVVGLLLKVSRRVVGKSFTALCLIVGAVWTITKAVLITLPLSLLTIAKNGLLLLLKIACCCGCCGMCSSSNAQKKNSRLVKKPVTSSKSVLNGVKTQPNGNGGTRETPKGPIKKNSLPRGK